MTSDVLLLAILPHTPATEKLNDLKSPPLFAKICHTHYHPGMSTMNISLPEALKSFVDAQVSSRGFGTSSEYVRELIRKDQERLHLRELLLAGASSKSAAAADSAYFASLRDQVVSRTAARNP